MLLKNLKYNKCRLLASEKNSMKLENLICNSLLLDLDHQYLKDFSRKVCFSSACTTAFENHVRKSQIDAATTPRPAMHPQVKTVHA